jgi:hypothetical protein
LGFIAVKHNFYLYYGVAILMAIGVTLATIGALTEAIKWVPRWEGMVRAETTNSDFILLYIFK